MKKQNPFLYFKFYLAGLLLLLYIMTTETKGRDPVMTENNFIFVTYVESVAALHDVYHLAESLRTFGGAKIQSADFSGSCLTQDPVG